MRQAPRSPLSFKLQRVANVPEHPPPSTRLMSCAHIANRQLSRIIGASRLSNARLRLTFYNAPVAYCGPARPGSAFQQSVLFPGYSLARARVGRFRISRPDVGQEMGPNRVELAHQLVPNGSALAALVNSKFPLALSEARDMQAHALLPMSSQNR